MNIFTKSKYGFLLLFLLGFTLAGFAQPVNDDCANATAVTTGTYGFNTTTATASTGVGCSGNAIDYNNDVWYSYTPPCSADITFSLCGSSYNTIMDVYTGSCGALTCLTFNDNLCGLQSQVTITSPTPMQTYYIRIGGAGGAFGAGSLIVTSSDNTPPVITGCPINMTVSNDPGSCDAVVSWTEPTASDNCGIQSFTRSHVPGSVFPVGTTVVTYTAVDLGTNTTTCTFTITVQDTEPPVITCPADEVAVADPGVCTANVTVGLATATDNCAGIVTITNDYNAGGADASGNYPVGTTVVTFTATDVAGNTSSCSINVTVNDTQNPVAACQNIIVSIDATGTTTITGLDVDNGSTDNCGIVTYSVTPNTFTCADVGNVITVTLTVTDAAGNFDQCTADVTVVDATGPIITCPADQVQNLNATCDAVLADYTGMTTATDACTAGTITITQSPAPGTPYSGVQTVVVTMTADDGNGNTSNCTFNVNFVDATAPTILTCSSDVTTVNDPGMCGANLTIANPTASDNCSAVTITNDFNNTNNASDFYPVGITTVVFTIEDASGNISTCDITITITDNENPVITCPANIVVSNDPGSCDAVVNYALPVVADNCLGSPGMIVYNFETGAQGWTLGAISGINTWTVSTATASTGNQSFGTQNVGSFGVEHSFIQSPAIMLDGQTIDFQFDTYINNENGTTYDIEYVEISIDNGATWNLLHTVPYSDLHSAVPSVWNTLMFTATGATGNTPTYFRFRYNTVDAVGGGSGPAPQGWFIDNVNITFVPNQPILVSGLPSGSTFPIGTTTNTYIVTDASGNTATCSFDVTVNDTEVPTITCPADITMNNDPGLCGAAVTVPLPVVTDNCGGTLTITNDYNGTADASDFYPVGTTTVVFTVEDASGNLATCSFTVTINDVEPPVMTCPADITVATVQGDCSQLVSWTTPIAIDNCAGSVVVTSSHPNPGLYPVGTTVVTLTASDAFGNTTTCSFNITVEDNENPVITGCPSNITVNAAPGLCGNVVSWTQPTASDNCPGVTLTASHNPSSFFPVGTTTVTYIATDASGNGATCTFTVTVVDNQAPIFSNCPANMSVNTDPGVCGASVTWTPPTATDNCPFGFTITSTHNPGDLFPVGTTTVTYTAVDASGNSAVCTFTVTVTDNEVPVVSGCPANMTVSNDAGVCGANVTWTAPTFTDNCPITITASHNPGDFFGIGTTTVTYTATDAAGNGVTCTFTITVNDTEAPVISGCPANISVNNDAGMCSAVVTWTAPTVTDNCPGVTMTSTHNSGDVFPVGTTTVTYTATDASGNTAVCSFTVTVVDTEVPTVTGCPANITLTNTTGFCGATATWTPPTFADNCPLTIVASHNPGDFFPVGTTTVTYTATDAAGNGATCTFNVIVADTENPVIVDCPTDIVTCGSTTATWTPPTATDNCPGVVLTSTHNPGDVFPPGTTTVTYTATDASGNTATCSFTVTIGVAVVADAGPDVDICFGSFVTIGGSPTGSGGTGTFTYSWSPIAGLDDPTIANPSASPFMTTTYTVTVTDVVSGCEETDVVTVTVLPLPIANAGVDREVCIGGSTVLGGFPTADEGTAPYTYFWVPSGDLSDPTVSNPTATPTVTTTYTLVVSDVNGCSRFDEVTVTVLDLPTVDAGVDVTVCAGSPTLLGGAPTATGTTAPYAYFWSPSTGLDDDRIANPTATPTVTTIYSLTVIDAKGCSATDEIIVTVNPAPIVDAGADVTICTGASTTIGGAPTASGSTAPYLFNWSPVTGLDDPTAANPVATPMTTTTYVVTVFDANGCVGTDTITVTVDPAPAVMADPVGPLCESDAPVMLTGTPMGGVWTGTAVTGNMFDPGIAGGGSHDVIYTFTNALGCTNSDTITIVVNPGPNSTITAAGPFCVTDGVQTLSAATAGGTFTGTGITNGTAGTFDPAIAGVGIHTITYTVTGPTGCISSSTINISVIAAPNATINPINPICVNAAPITLTTVTAGGTFAGPGVNATTGVFNPAVAGVGTHTITYTVINAQGCSATGSLTINVSAAPNATITAAGPFCSSANPVALTATTAGGFWSGPGITDPFNGIFNPSAAGVGTHTISYVVSNAQGCSSTATTTVTVSAAPNATITTPGVQCASNAPFTLTASTGGGTFSGPGVTGNTFNPGLAGTGTHTITYTVTVGGCTSTATTNIIVTDPVILNTNVLDIACAGNADGSISIVPTGGSGQFTFNWSTGATSNMISGLTAGTYTVTVSDINNCSVVASYDITQVGGTITATDIVIPTLTPQYSNGVIDIQVSGGTPPYTYNWSNGATTQDISGLAAGTYSVTVTDRLGCTQVFTYTVNAEFGTGVDLNNLVKHVNIYPNPTSDVINLSIELGGVHDLRLQVFDMLGRRIYEMTDEIDSRYTHSIDMSNHAAGQYMMMINIDGHVITKKFNVSK